MIDEIIDSKKLSIALIGAILVCYAWFYPVTQHDFFTYLLPWLRAINGSDGLEVFATEFSNYTGAYISVLTAVARVGSAWSELAVIKATAVIGTLAAALGVASCARALGWSTVASINSALAYMLLPSVMLNGIAWGQTDALYAAFVLYSMAAVLTGRSLTAALMLAIAVSIKFQAILFAPFLFGILLRTPDKLLLGVASAIPIYLVANGLYLVAGRPVWDVMLIYVDQAQHFQNLSNNAANPWLILELFLPREVFSRHYSNLVWFGIFVSGVASIAFARAAFRIVQTSRDAVILAMLSTLVLPFLLPKMHDRYFFLAESLIFVSFMMDRRYFIALIPLQLSTVLMYSLYHDVFGLRELLGLLLTITIGLQMMAITVVLVSLLTIHIRQERTAYSDELD